MINLNNFARISFFQILILKGLLHLNNKKKKAFNSKRVKIIQEILYNYHKNKLNKRIILIIIKIISQQYNI